MSKKNLLLRAISPILRRWHGIVLMLTISFTLGLFGLVGYAVYKNILNVFDAFLFVGTLLTVAIAVIRSNTYNYQPGSTPTNSLQEKAAKLQATWRHANHCWQAVNLWMTIIPLYCTCATIYISGSPAIGNDKENQLRIFVYSIISLVLSLGIYVLRPSAHRAGFQKAYLSITTALTKTHGSDGPDVEKELKKAIIEGENIIAKQDSFDLQ